MEFYLILLILISVINSSRALQCMSCRGNSTHDCDLKGKLQSCQVNQLSCETVVRRRGSMETVEKGCRETMACNNNQHQNRRSSGQSTQCNVDQMESFCTCCCDTEFCYVGAETCSPTSRGPTGPANDCPPQPQSFPHGHINCTNGICRYGCTEPHYDVYPKSHVTNICGANAKWSFDTPCCARPCPPFFLFDSVSAYHFRPQSTETIFRFLGTLAGSVVEAEDATISSTFIYGEEVITSSVIKLNEEFTDERFIATIRPISEGPTNTGAAIQFALDNILQSEFGMRDSRVPKLITIFTDSNSDDDVKEPAAKARSLGYLLYVFAFRREGVTLDQQQLMDITNDSDHIFVFDQDFDEFPSKWLEDLQSHYCQNPCVHVLHEHDKK